MAQTSSKTAIHKITLSASRDIPFNKLLLSGANVRRVKAGVSIEQLADDIARRTLLQSITVRPVLDADGIETGHYEIPAGGRRFRALELLVRQKRLAKTAPIPCVIRLDGLAEEDSLAENVQRAPLHPLDQFRAFLALRERGQSEEEVAAAFFVSVAVVKQRLRLASVSPKLLEVYAEDGMTLDQLMAFTVSGDWERQEQAWERLATSYTKEPYVIRRMLTESAVRASDKRARFVGAAAYEAAGGAVLRDLFQGDDGGWLEDVALLDRLAAERLAREAKAVRAEGWRWVEAAPDFPYGHTFGLRRLRGEEALLTEAELDERERLQAEFERLDAEHGDADVPDEVERRMAEIEAALAGFDDRPEAFDSADVARAGVFVSIDGDGRLRVDRGYVRPEDEAPIPAEPEADPININSRDGWGVESTGAGCADSTAAPRSGFAHAAVAARAGDGGDAAYGGPGAAAEPEDDEGIKPLSDRLLSELTAHRTLALRQAVGERPDVAFLAALHAACLKVFYTYALDTCLDVEFRQAALTAQAPGLDDSVPAQALRQRHQALSALLPREPQDLWDALRGMDDDTRQRLFAHCVSASVNGLYDAYQRRPRALAHADRLAEAVQLDMAAAGWVPTVDSYLGRVTKARIVQAVREARGEQAAQAIASLKKGDMAERAAELLAGAGWLPEPLRTPGQVVASVISPILDNTEGVPVDGGAWEASTEEVGAPVEADPGDEPGAVHPNNAEAADAALPDEAWQDAAE